MHVATSSANFLRYTLLHLFVRKARSTLATLSKWRSTMSKGRNFYAKLFRHCCRFWQQSRTLLRHCCWCGPRFSRASVISSVLILSLSLSWPRTGNLMGTVLFKNRKSRHGRKIRIGLCHDRQAWLFARFFCLLSKGCDVSSYTIRMRSAAKGLASMECVALYSSKITV